MAFIYGNINNCKVNNGQTRSEYQVRLGYQVEEQRIETNETDITLQLECRTISSRYASTGYSQSTIIDGALVNTAPLTVNVVNVWQVFGTRKMTLKHDSEGKYLASKGASFTTTAEGTWGLNSGSATVTVNPPQIPRYANIEQELTSKTETTANIRWSTDKTIDALWYSKSDGATWIEVDITEGTAGNYTITDMEPNTLHYVRTRVRRKDSQLESDSTRLEVTTYDYPHCIDSPNFSIGQTLTLKLYNPLSRLVTIGFIGAGDQLLSTDSTAMDTVTGYDNDSFVDKLYKSIPNSTASPYKISVVYQDNEYVRDTNNTYNIGGTADPIFTDFAYKDSNTAVTSVTGNDQVLIKGKSNLQVIISPTNKMVAQKYATPNKYIATIDSLSKDESYIDSELVMDIGVVESAGTKRLSVRAIDSRYSRTEIYKDITVLDYTKPVVNVEVSRLNNFENETTIKVHGTYDKVTVDGVDKNSITSVEYRYRETGTTEWSSWSTIKTTVSAGKFTCNDVVVDLDNGLPFEIEVKATDKLDFNTGSDSVDVGKSIFFISSNLRQCFINDEEIIMYDVVEEW